MKSRLWIVMTLALLWPAQSVLAQPAAPPAPVAAAPRTFDPRTLSVDLHAGPAVWKEEYWDVKPEKADAFVAAYRKEIYEVARKIPGYRGYTVLTLITSQDDPPLPIREGSGRMIQPHYSLWTGKKMLTERQINVGVLYRQTHNFIVVHHFRSWADADRFPAAFAAAYAKAHNGEDVYEGLRKTVFPLSNNYWETYFRMIKTGFPAGFAGPVKGDDADGLNLEPHPQPVRWVKEFFLVDQQDLKAFLEADDKYSYAAIRKMKGTSGMTMITSLPPGPGEAQQTEASKKNYPLGGTADFLVPSKGVLMDGTLPTDLSVNFSSLFRNTFSVVFYEHQQAGADMLTSAALDKAFADDNPGQNSTALLQKHFFPLARNHWDLRYRMIETSFSPTPD